MKEKRKLRDELQLLIYKILDPVVKFLIKCGLSPNAITTIGLMFNCLVAVIFIVGAEESNRGDLSYVGWAGAVVIFAGLFDMLDGRVARLGHKASAFGALYDSVLDRYSELIMYFGICYYLVAHHYFLSSIFAFFAMIGSLMVSYTRARAEGLQVECKSGLMQRPERVVYIGLTALACGIVSFYTGGNEKWYIGGFFPVETMAIFTFPLSLLAVFTNITAIGRLLDARKAILEREKSNKKDRNSDLSAATILLPVILASVFLMSI